MMRLSPQVPLDAMVMEGVICKKSQRHKRSLGVKEDGQRNRNSVGVV
jgi:hypothetical protein